MDEEIKVTIYIPRKVIREHGMNGCTVDLSFCDGKLCQAILVDGTVEESLYFDNGREENDKCLSEKQTKL